MKKIIILITIFIITTSLAYSHSFVMSLYVPLAGSRPSFHKNGILTDDLTENGESAFEVGVIFQPSIYFTIDKFHYIVLGVDFGWYRIHLNLITMLKISHMNLIILLQDLVLNGNLQYFK